MADVTYTNKVTGETYNLSMDLEKGETKLEAAWGRGFKVVDMIKGWQHFDVRVRVNN